MPKIIIAIDGYSACGKSSTAKEVARQMGYAYVDTGAMYRAVTLYFLQNHVSFSNPVEVDRALKNIQVNFFRHPETGKNDTFLNNLNVEEEIRKMYVTEKVSEVSAIPEVRKIMVSLQQKMGKFKGLVMDGRDIGTVVFPEAELKVFMTADPNIRAVRRQQELLERGEMVDLGIILENLKKRDHIDTTRSEGPLRKADDAVLLDNSLITLQEQVDLVIQWADAKLAKVVMTGERK